MENLIITKFINGREDLSNFQQQFEEFILSKGYDIERRELARNSRKKHKSTREWSRDMQKAKEMVELMDSDRLMDTAINGIMIESHIAELKDELEYEKDLITGLKVDKERYKNKATALEERITFIMMEQGYNKEFIEYEINKINEEDCYKELFEISKENELLNEHKDIT